MVLVRDETRIEHSKKRRTVKRRANKHQMILELWGQTDSGSVSASGR